MRFIFFMQLLPPTLRSKVLNIRQLTQIVGYAVFCESEDSYGEYVGTGMVPKDGGVGQKVSFIKLGPAFLIDGKIAYSDELGDFYEISQESQGFRLLKD